MDLKNSTTLGKTTTNENPNGGSITQNNYITISPSTLGQLCPLNNASATAHAICTIVDGDAEERYSLEFSGAQIWGNGSAAQDTALIRTNPAEMTLSSSTLGTPNGKLKLGTIYANSIITNSGDLFISPVGSNINVDSRNINNVNSMLFNATGLTRIQGTNNGVMSITDNGGTIGVLQVGTVNATSGDLSLNSATSDIELNSCNLNNSNNIDNADTIYSSYLVLDKQQPTIEVIRTKVPTLAQPSFGIRSDGQTYWGPGSSVYDVCLRRFAAAGRLVLSTSNATTSGGELYVDSLRSTTTLSLRTNSGNITIRPSAANLVMFDDNNGNDRIQLDPTNSAISFAPLGSSTADTFAQRTAAGTLTIGTTLGATNGTLSTRTFNANGTSTGNVALQTNISGDSTQRFVLDMDGQLGYSSGSAARDAWLYRDSANSLTLSTSSRGSSNGTFKTGALRSINYAEINNGVANTYNSTTPTQSVLIGQGHDLISPVRALVQGSTNTYYRASSSCIIGSTNSVLTTDSSSQANHAIIASTDVLLGTATGTTGSNCVIIASNGNTGSTIMRNGASRSLLKGAKIECNYSDVVMFADDGVGYGSLKAVGTNNVFECHYKNGFYFTTNASRSIGVQAGSGATSWSSISDLRLKQNINPIDLDHAYDAIDKVNVVNFSWKDDVENKQEFGMIAQEVQAAFSDFMPKQHCMSHDYTLQHPDEEPIGTVSGDHIAYLSLGLIKKQKQLINDLKAENMALKDIVIDLIKRVETLENAATATASAPKTARRNAKK